MTEVAVTLTENDFLLFQKVLLEESGLYFDKEKINTLEQVLRERLKERKFTDYGQYYSFLLSGHEGGKEIRELFDLLTIGETFFFRGAPHFDALIKSVLPEIINRKTIQGKKTLRIWSAGCSKGDEPYSLAIAVMEVLPDFREWNISILGTDINRNVLSYAREAVYQKRDVDEMPVELVEKYFKKASSHFILNEDVKKLVRFSDHNLAKDSFVQEGMQELDIIFCRNVTIYFDFPTTKKIINKFYDCLSFDGYLFIGYAETLWQVTDKFQIVEFPQAFIYKKSESGLELPAPRPFVSVPDIDFKALEKEPCETKDVCDARISLARADSLANEGKYPEAIVELERIVNVDVLCAEAYYLLGVLKYRTGNLREAEEHFKKVVYVDPSLVLAYYNLGNIYIYQNKFSGAEREFRNVLKLLALRPKDEKIKLCEDYTVEFLARACENSLEKLKSRRHNVQGGL